MSSTWISALARLDAEGTPAVMITVVDEKGSTPRNSGAKMLVSSAAQFDTIGGGHLEYQAIKIARQLLDAKQAAPRLERFSLGASLGQCCGGATTLLFEPLGTTTTQIALFGAGHVGRALAPILASLPCRVRWIDSRDEEFPEHIPEGVEKVVNEFPVDEIDSMPANSYFIVMTHNHQLDQALTEAILKRGDFDYYGLIGSKTKRKKFEHRLKARGFSDQQLATITCPLGIAEVKGKLPAEIAVSVAAEVIATYSAKQTAAFGNLKDQTPKETQIIERLAI
ncbi:MAG: xanthine dehydrogenase accessory factor [Motiliproteus sp.]|jgi:xanthine dehydrogenase accessory factor